ncbi:hypothetical protein MKS88_002580 [Plasmodium brasilianum]|uniref:Uncharacterized protein n=1 Tax=Plasmodium brasilianum TaxID=5824 RepID=A0ACB9YAE5_PLABR|nr:hypothetical protein MKS88_002580 [Plasmodium brasilianum]
MSKFKISASFGNSWNKEASQNSESNTRISRLLKGDIELYGVRRNENLRQNEPCRHNIYENTFGKEFGSIKNGKNLPKKYNKLVLSSNSQNYFDSFESIPDALIYNNFDSNDSLDQYASIDYLPDNNNKKQKEQKKKISQKLNNNGKVNRNKNIEINELSKNELEEDEYSTYEYSDLPYEQRVAKLEKLESIALKNEKSKSGFLNFLKKLDNNIELDMYRALKSDFKTKDFNNKKMSTPKKIIKLINHYKVFAPILINIVFSFVMGCLEFYKTQAFLCGITLLLLFYTLHKLVKLDSMRYVFKKHMRSL